MDPGSRCTPAAHVSRVAGVQPPLILKHRPNADPAARLGAVQR